MKIGTKQHFWTYQGADKDGNEYSNCERCGKWRKNGIVVAKNKVPKERKYD